MKRDLIPGFDISRCNAYSLTAHLYSAINVNNRTIFASNIEGEIDLNVPDDKKGGIIVFAQEENAELLSEIKLEKWIRQRFSASENNTSGLNDRGVQNRDFVGWTIGRFFPGRLTDKDGTVYSGDSLSVEIIGISDDALAETGEELCRTFNQVDVLIKMYSVRNRIIIVNGEKNT